MTALKTIAAWCWKWLQPVAKLALIVVIIPGVYFAYRLNIDDAESFDDPVAQFKYGSTGGDKNFGLPYVMWRAMPVLFRDHLPKGREDEGWAAFGLLYDAAGDLPGGIGQPRPVGTSLRNHMGIERIFLNCAACHTGRVRSEPAAIPVIYTRMPANTIDLQAFQNFLIAAALDERFTPEHFLAQIDDMDLELDFINRLALRFAGVYLVRERILTIRQRFRFADLEPAFGPGRFDTFSPAKALLNWPVEELSERERIGVVDFPSIWLQEPRRGMQLHWDGNNMKVEERNRSAAFGTGAQPPILDRTSLAQIENWLLTVEPPRFANLFPANFDAAAAERGRTVYATHCAACHGADGRDFTGDFVGLVTPIDRIGTDRARFDNYTYDLAVNQNTLYAEFGEERFQNFRKTEGYANMPLDGLWLRAPYLHNGSVPTLWDLLSPAAERPAAFLRGSDLYDPVNVGFESRPDRIPAGERSGLFCFMTHARGASLCGERTPENNGACSGGACTGNGNRGHLYGVGLTEREKRDLIEHLKTF